jgi:hypothetical protein
LRTKVKIAKRSGAVISGIVKMQLPALAIIATSSEKEGFGKPKKQIAIANKK